jgi:ABC-type nitrate/sulfonate/bicarbonate transport system substrate-binding protein
MSIMQHRRAIFTILLLLSFLSPNWGAAQTLLRVATPGALTGALPIYLGAKKGVFSKYGLTVEVIATRNEQMNMQALMSDSVQFLTSSSTGLFYLGKQGLDAVGLASWNNSSPYSLASRIKIKELKELKGRKIASSGAGGRADAYIRFMLAQVGLDHRTDADHTAFRRLRGTPRGGGFGQSRCHAHLFAARAPSRETRAYRDPGAA